jgi:uncharacterized protein YecT (DUF1311 family)
MKYLVLTLAILGSTIAHADPTRISAQYSECLEKAQSTADQNSCADDAFVLADAELNRTYSSIKGDLKKSSDSDSSEKLSRLVASQKAWITFRDTNCKLSGIQMLGGSGEGPIVGGCLATTTIERVKELQELFQ